jgi:hypothetical protein
VVAVDVPDSSVEGNVLALELLDAGHSITHHGAQLHPLFTTASFGASVVVHFLNNNGLRAGANDLVLAAPTLGDEVSSA